MYAGLVGLMAQIKTISADHLSQHHIPIPQQLARPAPTRHKHRLDISLPTKMASQMNIDILENNYWIYSSINTTWIHFRATV